MSVHPWQKFQSNFVQNIKVLIQKQIFQNFVFKMIAILLKS